jgi:hypothetical protein
MNANIPTAFFVYVKEEGQRERCIGLYHTTKGQDLVCLRFFAKNRPNMRFEPFFFGYNWGLSGSSTGTFG